MDENKKENSSNEEKKENDIPEMTSYEKNKISEKNEENNLEKSQEYKKGEQIEIDKLKKDIDKLKSSLIKKYPFIEAIGILPPSSIKNFIEEEEIPKEAEKRVQLIIVIPEEKEKEYDKIKENIIERVKESKKDIWINLKTVNDLWEICLDSKFDLIEAISLSYPIYDKGILGALRVAQIHKSLVLRKFEKYVVSYVIGGSLVRGEAVPTSDVDIFVIINDTDVKRMPRIELKERLRAIIYQYVDEASNLAGVQNKLSPQIYLLTDFWESVKDAHPVIFTFIRDGIPIYDRGTFMPWKALLRMGKLKPSPEAIDTFMSMGDKTVKRVKSVMLESSITELFWGITTPSQALLMLAGCAPPNAKKELLREFKREFYETKMIEKKYLDFLERVVDLWRDYEHEKIKEISGKEVDELLKGAEEYLKRLKDLRKQIEKKTLEKTIQDLYKEIFTLLKTIFGNLEEEKLLNEFDKKLIKKGMIQPTHLRTLKELINEKENMKKEGLNLHKVDDIRKKSFLLINDLIEYNQRCDLLSKKQENKEENINKKE
ncbi:hypothetical protein GYA25_01245 [Candidatus Woesearchaeota archaeon]|jgi:predicted nucleotidyltransferase/uncharacterized protein (UPF0332 family)|nr:hypothetical protein [Candidatus Woesearchaeota archaeon]